MAVILLTAAKIGAIFDTAEIVDMIAAVAITKGQAVYQTTSGTVGVADANDSGLEQFRGIALEAASIGKVVPVLKRGHLAGLTLTDQTWDDQLFLSDTAGALGDANGTMVVPVGRVVAMPDSSLTKVAYIEADWVTQWS